MRTRRRGKRGEQALDPRLMFKGIGLFKLAAGLVIFGSVLFLVPGLRLLVPGLDPIGTSRSQAKLSSEVVVAEKETEDFTSAAEKVWAQAGTGDADDLEDINVSELGKGYFSVYLGAAENSQQDSHNVSDIILEGPTIPFLGSGDLPELSDTHFMVEHHKGVGLRISR